MATGVSESRLRTWERRYGIPHPGRSDSGRRQYSEEDLTIIRRMAALVDAGVPASEAASAALTEGPSPPRPPARADHPLALELVDRCRAYDEAGARKALRAAVVDLGWERAIDDVLLTALRKIGVDWQQDRLVTASEHFASELVRSELACASLDGGSPPVNRSVMMACPEDERHDIGLLSLALLLRHRGIDIYYIGADVPPADLLSAVRATKADAIVLAATLRSSLASLERTARSFVSGSGNAKIYVGGPAFESVADSSAVPGIRLPRRVQDAARLIADSLGAAGKEAAT